jgi:hypothetical protein
MAKTKDDGSADTNSAGLTDAEQKAAAIKAAINPDAGPTVAEWVVAGYPPSRYPPEGYNSKSTKEEIDTLVALEQAGASKAELAAAANAQEPGVSEKVAQAENTEAQAEATEAAEAPRLGTMAAAEAAIADLPNHPTDPRAKTLDRAFTSGATG